MHSSFHIGQSLRRYSQFSIIQHAAPHCTKLYETFGSGCVCSYSQCEDMEEEVIRMQVTVMNGIRTKRKRNESIPQQGWRLVLRTCQCAFYWQACFIGLRHFQDMLSSEWRKKLTKKAENNSGEDHILSFCIRIKEIHLLDPRLPFQKTGLINGVH